MTNFEKCLLASFLGDMSRQGFEIPNFENLPKFEKVLRRGWE
jgi:hypothetical protein